MSCLFQSPRVFGLLGLLSVLPTVVLSQAIDLTGDVWDVSGTDVSNVNWDATTLVFTSHTGVDGEDFCELRGYFDWRSDSGASGREIVVGTLASNLDVQMQGILVINGNGILLGTYFVQLTPDGSMLINGNWSGSGGVPSDDWSAERVVDSEPLFVDDFERRCLIAEDGFSPDYW